MGAPFTLLSAYSSGSKFVMQTTDFMAVMKTPEPGLSENFPFVSFTDSKRRMFQWHIDIVKLGEDLCTRDTIY